MAMALSARIPTHMQISRTVVARSQRCAPAHAPLPRRRRCRLPRAPENLLGMIDVRGKGLPVLDLRLTLGMAPASDTENTRIVVLTIKGPEGPVTLGLRTDKVFEVTVLDTETLDPAPAISAGWSGHCIAGIGRRNGGFVTVLDLDGLLGDIVKQPILAA